MRARWVLFAVVLFFIGSLSLARSWLYYGHLLGGWDAQFYYAQARSLLFDADLDVTNDLHATPFQSPFDADGDGYLERPPRLDNGQIISKYPIGLSLLELPWLAAGHVARRGWESATGTALTPAPGYSGLEIGTVAIGLLVYFIGGMLLLAILIHEAIDSFWGVFAVVATWFGTSLFYYSAVFPFMVHAVSFTLVMTVIYQSKRLYETYDAHVRDYVFLAIICGLLFLVRPQQILVLFIVAPLLIWAMRLHRSKWCAGIVFGIVLAAIMCLLPLCNYLQTGSFVMNAYKQGGESFHWLQPAWQIVLVSPGRGILWMHPVVLLAIGGYIWLWQAKRNFSWVPWVLLLHALVQIYVIACWSSPHQGDAFGSRMWCESTPCVAVGLGIVLANLGKIQRWGCLGLTVLAASWNCALMFVYIEGPISHESTYSEIIRRLCQLIA